VASIAQPDAMRDLIEISRRYGADSAFVLAGGGNTSFKQGNRLWVKASGHALATIGADGFVELDRDALEAMLNSDWPRDPKEREACFIERVMAARISPQLNQRPSVEALLHHLLPDALVVHTHPGIVNALTCCINGEKLATELLGDEVLWQKYVDPGVILAQALGKSLAQHRQRTGRAPLAILLANHGLIVSGNSAFEIQAISNRIVGRIREHLSTLPPLSWEDRLYPSHQVILANYANAMSRLIPGVSVALDESEPITRLVGSVQGQDAALGGPLTPDQIVYCRSFPIWIENPSAELNEAERQLNEARTAYIEKHGLEPWAGLIAGAGLITFRDSEKLAQVTRSIFVDAAAVYQNAARLGGVQALGRRDQQFIEHWEVEAYRRSVMSKSASVAGS